MTTGLLRDQFLGLDSIEMSAWDTTDTELVDHYFNASSPLDLKAPRFWSALCESMSQHVIWEQSHKLSP
jgi:hypothetical protein